MTHQSQRGQMKICPRFTFTVCIALWTMKSPFVRGTSSVSKAHKKVQKFFQNQEYTFVGNDVDRHPEELYDYSIQSKQRQRQ